MVTMVSPPITGDSNCKKNSSSLLLKPGSDDADISRTSSGSCGSCCSFLSSRNRHVNQDFESLKIGIKRDTVDGKVEIIRDRR